jgi:CubicO group peptidase (beta-lactamase class C family)
MASTPAGFREKFSKRGLEACDLGTPAPRKGNFLSHITMNKILGVLLGLTFGACSISNNFKAQDDAAIIHVQDYIKRLVDNGKSTSIIIGIINERGQQIFSYGELEKGSGKKPNENTVYGIGSITKLFTCFLLADMANHGEVNLNEPISRFLPDSIKPPMFNGKEITLYHLATHTSGLPARPNNLSPANPDDPYADYSVDQLYEFLSKYKLSREIGLKYEYSNIGVGLLGYILTQKSGIDYETFLHKRICEPLDLSSTMIVVPAELQSSVAVPYNKEGQSVTDWTFSPVFVGAGSLKSTAHDMLIFVAANIGLINSELSSTFELTHVKHPGNNIALGWHIWDEFGTINYGHSGSSIGYKSFIGFNKKSKTGVIVLSNKTDAVMDIGLYILDHRYQLRDQ